MATPTDVTVAMSVVLREWGMNNARSVALRFVSKTATQEQQLAALAPGMPDLIDRVRGKANVTGPLPLLHTTVVLIYDCEEKPVLLSIVDEVADMMRTAGLAGRFTCGGGYVPMHSGDAPRGFGASVALPITLGGRDSWDIPIWQPDPDALDAAIEYALDWFKIEGARYWIQTGVGILGNEVHPNQIAPLLRASHRQSPCTTISAVVGERTRRATRDYRAEFWDVTDARTVEFDLQGHVTFAMGGHCPDWKSCVEELQTVLADLARHVEYGVVVPMKFVTRSDWRSMTARVSDAGGGKSIRTNPRDPTVTRTVVPTAFGTQLLGPGHRQIALDNQWVTKELPAGRRLITHRDAAAWYVDTPRPQLLKESRRSFVGVLEDDSLQPAYLEWRD